MSTIRTRRTLAGLAVATSVALTPMAVEAGIPTIDTITSTCHDGQVIHARPGLTVGSPCNDVIVGSPGDDLILGAGGDDEILGHDGDDIIVGGAGDDRLGPGAGDDLLFGGEGNDRLNDAYSGGFNSSYGGPGHDLLVGYGQGAHLFGEDGNDAYMAADGAVVADVAGTDALHIGGGSVDHGGIEVFFDTHDELNDWWVDQVLP